MMVIRGVGGCGEGRGLQRGAQKSVRDRGKVALDERAGILGRSAKARGEGSKYVADYIRISKQRD